MRLLVIILPAIGLLVVSFFLGASYGRKKTAESFNAIPITRFREEGTIHFPAGNYFLHVPENAGVGHSYFVPRRTIDPRTIDPLGTTTPDALLDVLPPPPPIIE